MSATKARLIQGSEALRATHPTSMPVVMTCAYLSPIFATWQSVLGRCDNPELGKQLSPEALQISSLLAEGSSQAKAVPSSMAATRRSTSCLARSCRNLRLKSQPFPS